jgi:hypothetical protein
VATAALLRNRQSAAKYEKRSVCDFILTKIVHIVENIIPFFEKILL